MGAWLQRRRLRGRRRRKLMKQLKSVRVRDRANGEGGKKPRECGEDKGREEMSRERDENDWRWGGGDSFSAKAGLL